MLFKIKNIWVYKMLKPFEYHPVEGIYEEYPSTHEEDYFLKEEDSDLFSPPPQAMNANIIIEISK